MKARKKCGDLGGNGQDNGGPVGCDALGFEPEPKFLIHFAGRNDLTIRLGSFEREILTNQLVGVGNAYHVAILRSKGLRGGRSNAGNFPNVSRHVRTPPCIHGVIRDLKRTGKYKKEEVNARRASACVRSEKRKPRSRDAFLPVKTANMYGPWILSGRIQIPPAK